MSEQHKTPQASPGTEPDLLDYWQIIWAWWWLIGLLIVISCVTTYFITKGSPKIYSSTVTMMATAAGQGGRGAMGITDLIKESGAGSVLGWLSGPMGGNTQSRTMVILKTNTLAKEIVDKFNLKEAYRTTNDIKAYSALRGATEIGSTKDGAILITVEDTDPKRAADLANYYPIALDRVLARMSLENISRQRAFIEERKAESQKALRQAEEALRAFQDRSKILVPPERQLPDAVKASADMRLVIMNLEVELEGLRRYSTEQNPQVMVLQRRVQEMKRQLAQLQYGTGMELPAERVNPGNQKKEIFLPSVRVPELSLEFHRLARDVKVQETVYQILTSQLENAKIEEARDIPTIELLDLAVPAEFAIKPQTRKNVIFAGAVGLFLGVFLAFFLEYLTKLKVRRQAQAMIGATASVQA